MRNFTAWGCCLLVASLAFGSVTTRGAEALPDFDELRQLIQTNLPDVTDAELDRKATEGLLHGFRGKVQLMASGAKAPGTWTNISKSMVFDGAIAYLRVQQVEGPLAEAVREACTALASTNSAIKGLVLDLRFAEGNDYGAAAATADLFEAQARDLLDWGNGMVRSTAKTNAWLWPIAVLVNGETMGAAEALAALVGDSGHGLVLGSQTLGAAMMTREFTLKDAQRVRVATAPIRFGGKIGTLAAGLTPDIFISVSPAEERVYWNDPYGQAAAAGTNVVAGMTNRVVRRPHANEADLVRARREGVELDERFVRQRDNEPEVPLIQDVALGRAVDLLKGLALVRRQP